MKSWIRWLLQLLVLVPFWLAGLGISAATHAAVPGGVAGMLLLLAALHLRWVRLAWLEEGAGLLLRHMLLFFIPAAVGVMQHPEFAGRAGARVALVIAVSTVLVMSATGLAAELVARARSGAALSRAALEERP